VQQPLANGQEIEQSRSFSMSIRRTRINFYTCIVIEFQKVGVVVALFGHPLAPPLSLHL